MDEKDITASSETEATESGEKFYDEAPYMAWGGATSFSELREFRKAQEDESKYYVATLDYQDLSSNILRDPELDANEKVSALMKLTNEFQDVVTNIDEYYKEAKEDSERPTLVKLTKDSFITKMKKLVTGAKEAPATFDINFDAPSGFKVFETSSGYRWLSFSSNAFKDLDGELFTTKALEEAVAYHDACKEYGPLRLYHIPDADFGDADYMAVIGRFLVESGTFRDDELGQKALEYFRAHPEEQFQVSIGFMFKEGDERDGVYEWLRVKERSLCPFGKAANPFTSFAYGELGGMVMDEGKMKMLTDFFGEDTASKIVGKAEAQTKELEGSVAFKELDALKAAVEGLPEGDLRSEIAALVEKHSKTEEPEVEESKEQEDEKEVAVTETIDLATLVTSVQALAQGFTAIKDSLEQVQVEIKGMKEEDEKKSNAPRGSTAFRASESESNVLKDPGKLKEILQDEEEPPVNPARSYVEDLFHLVPGANGARS